MAFTISGNTITQTGTDTSLAGLEDIIGVEVFEIVSGPKILKTSHKLQVNGSLTFNPLEHQLHLSANPHAVRVGANALLKISQPNVFRYPVGLHCTYSSNQYWAQARANIRVDNNGTLELDYACIELGSTIFLPSSHSGFKGNGYIRGLREGQPVKNSMLLRSWSTSGFDLSKLILENYGLSLFRTPTSLGSLTVSRGVVYPNGARDTGSDNYLLVRAFASSEGGQLAAIWGSRVHALNAKTGADSDLITMFDGGPRERGGIKIETEYELTLQDVDGNPIENAKIYQTDYDNGKRKALVSGNGTVDDFTGDFHNTAVSNSEGKTGVVTALLAVFSKTPANEFVEDYRTRDSDDILVAKSISHTTSIGELKFDGKGTGVKTPAFTLLPDNSVTQEDETTVSEYTSIDTAQKFYDRAKLWLVDNYTGQTETLVTRSGDVIDAGSYDVVLDKTASTAFAFESNTITIRSRLKPTLSQAASKPLVR